MKYFFIVLTGILFSRGLQAQTAEDSVKAAVNKMFKAMKDVLAKGVLLGGDSMSDYRNAFGEKGGFQKCHQAYRRTGKPCEKPGCRGKKEAIITRIKVGGRSAHFCPFHQK